MGASFVIPSPPLIKQVVPWTVLSGNGNIDNVTIADMGYGCIHIPMRVRTNDAGVNGGILLTLNNLGGTNYRRGSLQQADATVTDNAETASSSFQYNVEGAGQTAEHFSYLDIYIMNYASSSRWKEMFAYGYRRSTITNDSGNTMQHYYGRLENIAQITELDIVGAGGTNLVTGSGYAVELLYKQ